MIALDSSALIAILQMEPGAKELASMLVDARIKIMSAVTLLETSMALARAKGDDLIWGPLDALLEESEVEIVAFDHEQANAAREAFMRFGKGRHPAGLNFGDCAAYALAKTKKAPLLFKGSDFAKTDIVPALR
jgi:ribonuclease VapC